jgi:prepilin-type N-terminal cleavage/methylation domain-containing protein
MITGCHDSIPGRRATHRGRAKAPRCGGFTLIESLVAVAIICAMAGFSIPMIRNMIRSYRLTAAASAVSGAIQSTRYQAIMVGCPYTVTFTQTSTTYQIATEPVSGSPPACATSFSNLGGAIPWGSAGDVTMSPSTTLQFSPSGMVTATTGSLSFTLSNGLSTKTVNVSGVGNVQVASQ